ncbi:MAG TPA: hypothetical protein VFX78_13790 [Candidatus Eisenbacteria bacterium]|nr:hypothetical protein [Candidatus Eisenbacteria bacterium]
MMAPAGFEGAMLDLERLAGQLECQVPAEAVLIFRILREQRVPNVSRKKVLALAERVGGELGRVLAMEDGQLAGIVGKKQVGQVRKAVLGHLAGLTREQSARQLEEAREDPGIEMVVEPLLRLRGERFEAPVRVALGWIGWPLREVDQGGPKKKPDLEGTDECGTPVVVECKTAEDLGGEVSREEATALCGKAPEGFAGTALTVGRPVFSDAAIEAAIRRHKDWPHNRLVTAGALAELILSVRFRGLPRAATHELLRTALCLDVSRVVAEVRRLVESPAAAAGSSK